jgi:hypothetical protein
MSDQKMTLPEAAATLEALARVKTITEAAMTAARVLGELAADPKTPQRYRLAAAKGLVERVPAEVWRVVIAKLSNPAATAALSKE